MKRAIIKKTLYMLYNKVLLTFLSPVVQLLCYTYHFFIFANEKSGIRKKLKKDIRIKK